MINKVANLVVDIGNTALKAAWSDGMTLGKTFRYQGERMIDFIVSLTRKAKPDVMVISSVSDITPQNENRLKAECSRLLLIDGLHKDLAGEYDVPAFLSADRMASIVASRYLFKGKGCTLFDFGTTLTIDFLDEEGKYCGGNISLGCRTRFKSINRYSKVLPLLDTPEVIENPGTSLTASVQSGIMTGMMYEIEGYLRAHPNNIVVFTGGDAIYFAKRMKNSIFVVCNLVLMGLALIAGKYDE